MRERTVHIDEPLRWADALADVPHGFDHTWACCHAASLSSGLPTYLYVAERDGVRVVCPFSERRLGGALDLVTPHGFSGFASNAEWAGFAECWHAFAVRRGAVCSYTAQHPAFGRAVHDGPFDESTSLYLLDLREGAAATLARARKGRRRELRVWHSTGSCYVTDRDRLTAFVLAQHEAFMDRVGAGSASRHTQQALRQFMAAPGSLLIGAGRSADAIEAAALFGATRWGAEGVLNINLPHGRQHTVALMAWFVEAFAAQGVPWLNLGGAAREGDTIAAAKRQWNPCVSPLRRLKIVHQPEVYRQLCRDAGVSAVLGPGYFPAYHRTA